MESDNVSKNISTSLNKTQNKTLINNETYKKTTLEFSPIITEYTSGNIIYTVKAYSLLNYNGMKYKDPKYNSLIKIKLYTGNSFKSYSSHIDNNGIASIKVPDLSIGYHKVEIFIDNVQGATSYIKVIKSTTKVYAPTTIIKFKKNMNYKIKVVDSHNNPVKNIILKVKVYTDSKYNIYSIKTNSKGLATLKINKLSLKTHKIVITTNNKNYKINKNSKILIKKTIPKKIETLTVSSPNKTIQRGTSFTIKLTDDYNDIVKKVSIKVNIYTGKKFKTFKITTNNNGVAKLKTDKLSLGTHNLKIASNNKNYKFHKTFKITLVKTIIHDDIKTLVLKNITYYQTKDGKFNAKLGWYSKVGSSYQILRKTNENYNIISTVKSNSSFTTFYDKIDGNASYTYSVREIIVKNNDIILGPYDKEGLKLLKSPNITADFQNLKAEITWNKVEGATKYIIFRKIGRDANFKAIGIVNSNVLNYTDFYYKTPKQLRSILNSNTFVDPSFNNLFYTVRACTVKNTSGINQISYGSYLIDGDFHLEAPSIISLKDNEIKWGKVPNADGYLILKKNSDDDEWTIINQVAQNESNTITLKLNNIENSSYYSVKAFAKKNGEIIYSKFDSGFSLKNYSKDNSKYKILYFGDSITYGSPYKSNSNKHIFSIPYRVGELLGCVYYNPSIPGSTYHDLGQKDGKNIENTKYYRYRICREVVDQISIGELPGNWKELDNLKNSEGITNTYIDDYNIVVLAAGTNDYLDNSILGSINSVDTHTFNGALNHILNKIETASKTRVERGESPIKVIFVDLCYSDRAYDKTIKENRDVTKNKIGLTLNDYQNALNKQYNKWKNNNFLTLYNFKTRDYNIVNQENCPYTTSDNLHFSKFTYGQYGNAFASFLKENIFYN
ncbi:MULTISPECIES: SGNH/GDSL hydrolase family protein [Methanobrevibacter]|uniref:Uncharacterized protein n=1 Tax=Methanobrevibacter gottschalkii DSM 11977 TaxID=1122229 RepID=A0A3N5B402_9EURY|nr:MULTISPECIES: SGNH/GDSL hydrolase family protein [Methanobrevibacter]OEC97284.1 hypothetical protein A9505_05570 [Methanobrevibacter sp. A27]RPF51997.1 hypothetical protein EDC42_1341 [Methanobrevibacter gottschalkii DSM 11977]